MSVSKETSTRGRLASGWLITLVSFVAMIAATAYVLRVNWPAGGMPLLAWQSHAGALVAVAVEVVTRALKIQASAYSVGSPIGFATALRVCLAGDFAAAVTPARSGAEPARFLVLAEAGLSAPARVILLFLELFLEMCSLAIVCIALAIVFSGRGASAMALMALVGGYSTFVLGAGAIGLILARRRASGPPPAWLRLAGVRTGAWRSLQRMLRQLRVSVDALRHADMRYMTAAFAGSILHVICKVAALPLLVYPSARDFPLTMDTIAPLVLWPLALFYGGVVVPAPGGGGFVEGAFAVALKDSIPTAVFAASLLWWRFYTFYLYIIVGGLAAGDAALRAIRRRHPSYTIEATDSGIDTNT